MKIYLTSEEVIELAYDCLDMNCPDPDKVHSIAERMDMVYDESLDLYEDVESVYIRMLRNRLLSKERVIYENKMLVRPK